MKQFKKTYSYQRVNKPKREVKKLDLAETIDSLKTFPFRYHSWITFDLIFFN